MLYRLLGAGLDGVVQPALQGPSRGQAAPVAVRSYRHSFLFKQNEGGAERCVARQLTWPRGARESRPARPAIDRLIPD